MARVTQRARPEVSREEKGGRLNQAPSLSLSLSLGRKLIPDAQVGNPCGFNAYYADQRSANE